MSLRFYRRAIWKLTTVLLNIPESSNLSRVWQYYVHYQFYLLPCFSTYVMICILTCWWIVFAKSIISIHYYGIRTPHVWAIMQLNKKNSAYWIHQLFIKFNKCHFSRYSSLAEQGKGPTPKLNGRTKHQNGNHASRCSSYIAFFPTGLSPQPIQEKCLYY